MSYPPRALRQVALTSIALVLHGLALSAQQPHNYILIVPEALPSMEVNQTNAPTLAKLKREGVSFINSHSGFPELSADDSFSPRSDLQVHELVRAAQQKYSGLLVRDVRGSSRDPSEELRKVLDVTLPRFKEAMRPFLLVYRIGEPKYAPPVAGEARPAYRPDPRATDITVVAIERALKSLGLFEHTNIVVAAERAYSRVLKVSHTSRARTLLPREETLGTLPSGFLAVDVAAALQTDDDVITLFDPDKGNAFVDWSNGGHPSEGNAIVVAGYDPAKPLLTVEAHGAHSSIFLADTLSRQTRKHVAQTVLEAMLEQDYLGGVFVDETNVGPLPGALSISHLVPAGGKGRKHPDMVIAFATVSEGCRHEVTCTSVIADTPLPEGEGIPNSFNRAGTWTFMAARGPDFQAEMTNRAPASNADISRTIAEMMDLDIEPRDWTGSRVLTESLMGPRNRIVPRALEPVYSSTVSIEGLTTRAHLQTLGAARYFRTAIPARVEPLGTAWAASAPKEKWWQRWKRITIEISDDEY